MKLFLVTFESDGSEYKDETVVAVASSQKNAQLMISKVAQGQSHSTGQFRLREVKVDSDFIRYFDDACVGKVIKTK